MKGDLVEEKGREAKMRLGARRLRGMKLGRTTGAESTLITGRRR